MLEKCPACGGRILAGGSRFLKWTFCNDRCESRFKAALTDRLVPAEAVAQQIGEVFESDCPLCKRPGKNDLYSSTTVTGMLLVHRIESQSYICCARCARKKRLMATAHCLALGWWSPHSFFYNMFVLPSNPGRLRHSG